MADEKKASTQRRQAGKHAAESGRNLRREQKQAQVVADHAAKQVKTYRSVTPSTRSRSAKLRHSPSKRAGAESIRFLNTEADVGLNLARIAAESRNAEKKDHTRRRAREAYDSVLKYLDRAAPRSEELEAIQQKMTKLRELLETLGERVSGFLDSGAGEGCARRKRVMKFRRRLQLIEEP